MHAKEKAKFLSQLIYWKTNWDPGKFLFNPQESAWKNLPYFAVTREAVVEGRWGSTDEA